MCSEVSQVHETLVSTLSMHDEMATPTSAEGGATPLSHATVSQEKN